MLPEFLKHIGAWLGLTYGIYRIFDVASKAVNKESKRNLSKWLNNIPTNNKFNWSAPVIELFEAIYTKTHFSFLCFTRSIIISCITMIALALIFIIRTDEYGRIDDFEIYLFLIGNFFIDYISLYETRLLLRYINLQENDLLKNLYFIIDILLTFLIFFVFGFINFVLYEYLSDPIYPNSLNAWIDFLIPIFTFDFESIDEVFLTVFLSTFSSTFWILIFLLPVWILKILNYSNSFIKFFKKIFDVEDKPFESLGAFLIIIITLLYLIWSLTKIF